MSDPVNHPPSVIQRFWKYANRSGAGCWLWSGSRMVRGGYGQLNDRGRLLKAHRLSYELHHGEIPPGLFVCHRCNVPACVNPEHLYAGTPRQNWDDTIAAGTRFVPEALKGTENPNSKLSENDVLCIRREVREGNSLTELAKRYGVTKQAIWRVKERLSWKSL